MKENEENNKLQRTKINGKFQQKIADNNQKEEKNIQKQTPKKTNINA